MLDQAVEDGAAAQRERDMGQTSIFGDELNGRDAAARSRGYPPCRTFPNGIKAQRLKYERELTGFYITSHPLARYEATIHALATATTTGMTELSDGRGSETLRHHHDGEIHADQKGRPDGLLTLEDLQGMVEVIVFPDLYQDRRRFDRSRSVSCASQARSTAETKARRFGEQDRTAGRCANAVHQAQSTFG